MDRACKHAAVRCLTWLAERRHLDDGLKTMITTGGAAMKAIFAVPLTIVTSTHTVSKIMIVQQSNK